MTFSRPASWQDACLKRYYHSRKSWIDGTAQYLQMIRNHLPRQARILELGPGPENRTSTFLAQSFSALDALDIDEEARSNPALGRLYVSKDTEPWPIKESSYDAVAAN